MLYLPLKHTDKPTELEDRIVVSLVRQNRIAMVEAIKAQPVTINHNFPGGQPSPALAAFVRDYNERSIGGRI